MSGSFQSYRDAVAKRVHAICLDRTLDPDSRVPTETGCRVDRFLSELIGLVSEVRSNNLGDYEVAISQRICPQCGSRDATGRCSVRDRADCCLFRYLPLVLDAIEGVQEQEQRVGGVEMLGCA